MLRGSYIPAVKTGYVILAGWDPKLSIDSLFSLMAPPISWLRSLEASRIVVVIPEPLELWEQAMASLGLSKAVSSSLMIRPTSLVATVRFWRVPRGLGLLAGLVHLGHIEANAFNAHVRFFLQTISQALIYDEFSTLVRISQ